DNTGPTNVAVFQSGSTYTHNAGVHPFALPPPDSRVVFQPGSLARYLGSTGSQAFAGRVYGDCEDSVVPPTQNIGDNTPSFGSLTTTGAVSLPATTLTFHISGNLTVTSPGILDFSTATALLDFNGAAPQTISLDGPNVHLPTASTLAVNGPGLTLGNY